ncbi:muconolactone Delta-isomerase family protein [Halotia branconii]|uniref:Muconolactone Delta-isomerase family protein n=1 Tax=Halotia branconii CENA392 TaxID=1539056 RepID=A0AAJ6P7G2_9CYAN|nr:muconolactone Delta-isomerase family protein [Halotia branconii]WGV23591.1 muconolactone Delta-isomerase family protein [Halotia branconii CENA392]
MLYHLDFQVEYAADMSQQDLLTIWKEEADTALAAKQNGTIVDLWKCVGMRRVIAIVDVPSPDILDQILLDLPVMKKMGQYVHVEVVSLRRYEDFATDVSDRLDSTKTNT